MCTQKPPHDYSQQLYDKYKESFEEYITSTVRKLLAIFVLFNSQLFLLCNIGCIVYTVTSSVFLGFRPQIALLFC